MVITQKELEELEFPVVLKSIAENAIQKKALELIVSLHPSADRHDILRQLTYTNEYLSSLQSNTPIPFQSYHLIEKELQILPIENAILTEESFLTILSLHTTIKDLKKFFVSFNEYYPELHAFFNQVPFEKQIEKSIKSIISKYGKIKDSASPDLEHIRKSIETKRIEYADIFAKTYRYYHKQGLLDEIGESIIDGIQVLAVKSTFKKRVKGAVLGVSSSGNISYVHPESVKKIHGLLQSDIEEEKLICNQILKELTQQLAPYHEILKHYQDTLLKLDVIRSKALYAQQTHSCMPLVLHESYIDLKKAYHPILLENNRKEGVKTLPQNLYLNEDCRLLCISGPNAGGKSITLKTVGLLQVMFQSGILIPVHPTSKMGVFQQILTDIGDNQSIENHLSTYSSRLQKISRFIQKTSRETLILIDEFGTGSDPELGGALAEVFLTYFYEQESKVIITTHYTNLKLKVDTLQNGINACMLFNEATLTPLYTLEIGRAGSSFTFEVAQKNGIPQQCILEAQKLLEREKVKYDRTLVELQQEKFTIAKIKDQLHEKLSQTESNQENIKELELKRNEKLSKLQMLFEQEQKRIQYGEMLQQWMTAYLNGKNSKGELSKKIFKFVEQEKIKQSKQKTESESREEVSEIRKSIKQEIKKKKPIIQQTIQRIEQAKKQEFTEGQRVKIKGSTSIATIEKLYKDKALLNYGKFTTEISIQNLESI